MSFPGVWGFLFLHRLDGGDGFLNGAESMIARLRTGEVRTRFSLGVLA
jgi:hypothetical protein